MSAILRLYTPAAQYKDLHGSLFDELRKTRFPDDWWDKEGWDGLEDIVEDFGIDTAAYPEPPGLPVDTHDVHLHAVRRENERLFRIRLRASSPETVSWRNVLR